MFLQNLLALTAIVAVGQVSLAGDDPSQGKKQGQRIKPEAVFAKLDTNGDGMLTPQEFSQMKEKIQNKFKQKGRSLPANATGERLFKLMDTNQDGMISLDEFKKGLEKLANRAKNGSSGKKNFGK